MAEWLIAGATDAVGRSRHAAGWDEVFRSRERQPIIRGERAAQTAWFYKQIIHPAPAATRARATGRAAISQHWRE